MKNKPLILSGMMVTVGLAVSVSWAMVSIDESLNGTVLTLPITPETNPTTSAEMQTSQNLEPPVPSDDSAASNEVSQTPTEASEAEPESSDQTVVETKTTDKTEPTTAVAENKSESETYSESDSEARSSYAS